MKKATLFIAPLGAKNKKDVLFKEIVSRYSHTNDYSDVLYIGPNRSVLSAAGNLFFNYLQKTRSKSAYIPFQSLTIKQLASNLHEAYGESTAISDSVRTLMIAEILNERNIGYARLLSSLYRKIRNHLPDKSLSGLKNEIRRLIFEEVAGKRAVKAIEALESYEDELKEKILIDPEGILLEGIAFITSDAGRSMFDKTTLIIDGFFDPTPLEMEVIRTLIDKAENVMVLVEEHTEILKYFRLHGEGMAEKRLDKATQRKNRGYFAYPSIEEEVEGIAKEIKKLLLEGMPPGDIAVCFPSLSRYLPMLQRVFKKHGIPQSIGEYNLSATMPFTLLEEIITCIEEDYPRSDLLSILTSPYLPSIPDIIKEKAVTYSYRAGIVKGKESWLSIKQTLLNAPGPDTHDDEREELDAFQSGLTSVIKTFEALKLKKDILSFTDSFESTLNKLGFINSLETSGPGKEASGKIMAQLSELRQFAGIIHASDIPGFYLRYLLQDLKGSNENREGVKVLPLEIAAGLETRILFFGGILEGDFPSRPDIDPILPENVKKALGIPHLEYYLKRQKLYFNRLLNTSELEPHFSAPYADGDKIFLPSPFLDWGKAANPVRTNLFSEEEVLVREGSIHKDMQKTTFSWSGKMLNAKKDSGAFQKRLGMITRGHFSVTNIDFYRKCPLRFYIEKVLGLEMEAPPKYEVEARLWGSLAHKTMEYVFDNGDIDLDLLDKEIFKGLEKSLKQFPIGDFWSGVAKEIFRNMLPMIKEQENEIRLTGYSPHKMEHALKTEINGIKLKGKIDRIDFKSESGNQKPEETAILIDYKTGSIDSDSLQLPLYASMWQEESSIPVEKVGYYSLKEGRVSWYPKKKITMDEFMHNALERTEAIVTKIMAGEFPALPAKNSECRYCYHSPFCEK